MHVYTIVCETLIAATPHGFDKGCKIPFRQCLPLCLQHLEQVLDVCGRYMVVPHPAVQLIPNMFSRVKVRTAHWPVHPVDPNMLQADVHDLCPVGSCSVILVHCLWSHLTYKRNGKMGQDLVPAANGSQVSINQVLGRPVVQI